ncbi:DUF1501 domain-containing protein [Limnoglobus roseus]|uniref:DUF1501 domain-containing protein n=1 Tax=Limnoglobus roseus TaxID=2598579 RepID=A0A5C1AJ55_9BACT|nr:DUF1501 domain-containing protein [Limnoglobus roseus]QEL18197.1 hypothetical protein PX52LOC_05211 [Limnoglobus roseus]
MATRRDFLKSSTLLGFGGSVPAFLGTTALAAPASSKAGAKDTILVVVQLTGGNDGLNTVIPFKNELYAKYRPTIAVPKDKVFGVNAEVGLHPSMAPLGQLLNEQSAACIVQGVGYPNPDQSHFRSMDIWQAASTDATLTEGWLGKAMKAKPVPAFHLAADNEIAPLALNGAPARVPSVAKLEDFQLKIGGASGKDKSDQKTVIEAVTKGEMTTEGQPKLLDFVRRTAINTYESTDRLREIGKNYEPKVPYPASAFANRLKLAAQLIDAGIGARLFYVSLDGFDTHAGQGGAAGNHANLLATVAGGISAFYRDLSARGHGDRVCVMTFSEFGRRAKENGSNGTDHGSGAPMFLVGGKVKAGVVGDHPSLEKLADGNLVHSTDFRQIYAAVLEKWLGVDPKPILGEKFKPLDVFKA